MYHSVNKIQQLNVDSSKFVAINHVVHIHQQQQNDCHIFSTFYPVKLPAQSQSNWLIVQVGVF